MARGSAATRENHTEKARARRLAEREHISGEIQTAASFTSLRSTPTQRTPTRRSSQGERNQASSRTGKHRTPVSSNTVVPERTISGRMILLTVVALVVVSFLVPTVRSYLQQSSEMTQLQEQIAVEEQRQGELYTEITRWDDPDYVRQQARERVNLVMPGEQRYHVIGEGEVAEEIPESLEDAEIRTDLPWTEALWDSVLRSAAPSQ